jgi:4-amino-4-deoxy-L-arabinose transferase-like glycosyltransferase
MTRSAAISVFSGLAAFLLAAAMVNHGLVNSHWPDGPGLTPDESFNIEQGIYLCEALAHHGPLLLTPAVAREVFGSERFLPDHPPLGRLILGSFHSLLDWIVPGSESTVWNIPAARLGSCASFALMVTLLTEFTRRRYGNLNALCTALLLIGTPHLVGHARLAALESATNLAWMAAALPLLSWWTGDKPPNLVQAAMSGLLFGLLLLTKVQGILLPPIVAIWALVRFRWAGIRPLMIWGVVGSLLFFAGWPWLWLDPVENILRYLGRTTNRDTLYCWYFGERYADKAVPWHFPFVMTLISLPLLTVCGLLARIPKGCRAALDSAEWLLCLLIAFPLMVFSIPGVPVYDGTRLFLIVMPSICLLAARGIARWLEADPENTSTDTSTARSWLQATTLTLMAVLPLFQTFSPLASIQYGLLCRGNRGAAALGMETSYWSEALNADFWNQVPANSTVYVAPVSHQFQLSDLQSLVPVIHERNIKLEAFKYDLHQQYGLLLLVHRLADLRPELASPPTEWPVVVEVRHDGVVYARLVNRPRP